MNLDRERIYLWFVLFAMMFYVTAAPNIFSITIFGGFGIALGMALARIEREISVVESESENENEK